jgi:hypothetical protein
MYLERRGKGPVFISVAIRFIHINIALFYG